MSRRFGRVQRFGVLLILGWTALDLGYPVLCALDREQLGPVYGAYDVVESSGSSSHDSEAPAPVSHIDDCFCCSHCVAVSDVARALTTASVVRQVNIQPPPVPLFRTFPIYHPPQFSL